MMNLQDKQKVANAIVEAERRLNMARFTFEDDRADVTALRLAEARTAIEEALKIVAPEAPRYVIRKLGRPGPGGEWAVIDTTTGGVAEVHRDDSDAWGAAEELNRRVGAEA